MQLQALVNEIAAEMMAAPDRGEVADYIPRLAIIDPAQFGIAIVTREGAIVSAGDAEQGFSIQSISKVFSLTLALGKIGDRLWSRVGREPSGTAFNSIVQLEMERGVPRNPFVNAGAIVVTDANLSSHAPRESIGELLRFIRYISSDDTIAVDRAVARSERDTGERNRSLAHYIKSFGNLNNSVDSVLWTYFHACAVEMNCRQLAMAGRYLMLQGRHFDGGRVIPERRARRINALMMTCGHYDASGDFAFRVGMPGKSGVGGGIIAIVPDRASIAVWSPGLNQRGNSQLGTLALERIADATGWGVFG